MRGVDGVPPARIGPYVLGEPLGAGGVGAVYRAWDAALGREVAVKLLLDADPDPGARHRFRREAEALARLRHPNVVRVHAGGDEGGRCYLVLDLVEGGSLRDRLLSQGPGEPREAVRIALEVARGLAAVHRAGLLHRDVKPDNVLLAPGGRPQLTDFGLARARTGRSLTATGQVLGTDAYMAPEQAQGQEALDPRVDLYALGATLYELLVGEPPFLPPHILRKVVHRPPRPPSARRSGLSPDLDRVCLACLEKRPGDRYPDAEALAADLERVLRGEPVRIASIPLLERTWRGLRRSRLVGPGGLGLVAVVLAGAALALPRLELRPFWAEAPAAPAANPAGDEAARRASQALDVARRQPLALRAQELASWLSAQPGHPRAPAARQLLRETNLLAPYRSVAHPGAQCGRLLPGGERAITGSSPSGRAGTLRLWDLRSGARLREWTYANSVFALDVTPDGTRAVCGGNHAEVWLLDLSSGEARQLYRHPRPHTWTHGAACTPDGKQVALATTLAEVLLLDLSDGRVVERFQTPGARAECLALTPTHLAVGSGAALNSDLRARNALWVWDLRRGAGSEPMFVRTVLGVPQGVALSSDARELVAACDARNLRRFSLADRQELPPFRGEGIEPGLITGATAHGSITRAVGYLAGGRCLVSISSDEHHAPPREIRAWSRANGRELWRQIRTSRLQDLHCQGQRVLVTSSQGAELWDLAGLPQEQ